MGSHLLIMHAEIVGCGASGRITHHICEKIAVFTHPSNLEHVEHIGATGQIKPFNMAVGVKT